MSVPLDTPPPLRDPKTYNLPSAPHGKTNPAVLGINVSVGVQQVQMLVVGGNDVLGVVDLVKGVWVDVWCYSTGQDGTAVDNDLNEVGNNQIHDLAYALDPNRPLMVQLFASGSDGTFRHYYIPLDLFTSKTVVPIIRVKTYTIPTGSAAFSLASFPDGTKVFAGCADGSVWQYAVGKDVIRKLVGHEVKPVWDMWCGWSQPLLSSMGSSSAYMDRPANSAGGWQEEGRMVLYTACFDRTVMEWDDVGDEEVGNGVKEITYRRMWRFGEGVNSVCVVDVEGAALLASSVTQPLGVSMPARRGLRRRTLSNTSLDEVIRRDREARLLDDDYVAPPGGMSPSPATPSLTSSTLTSSMSLTSSISVTSAASKISEPRALPSPARLVRRRASMEFEEDPPSIETARCLLVGLERGSIVELDISAGAPTPRLSSSPHPPPPLITPFPPPYSLTQTSSPSPSPPRATSPLSFLIGGTSSTASRRRKTAAPVMHVGHSAFVTSLQVVPGSGGKWFVSGCEDGTVRVWRTGDSRSGCIVHSQKIPGNEIYSLSLIKKPDTLQGQQQPLVVGEGGGEAGYEGQGEKHDLSMLVLVPGGEGRVQEVLFSL